MLKSSVYLPDALKAELAALAGRWGRSEAELIRLAIERLVRTADTEPAPGQGASRPMPAVAPGPRLVGVGVGPSDPDLVTERALAVLRAADRVVAASTGPDAIGRAEAVVRSAAPDTPVDRVVIDIAGDEGARRRSVEAAAEALLAHLDRGELVAFAVLGDPNVWTVFPRVADAVAARRPGVPVETVPGIMAFQELAARSATVLADGEEELTLVTLGDDAERLDPLLADPARGLVVYKGGRVLPEVAAVLERRGRLGSAVLGEMLGLPGGRSVPVAAAADRPASYLATVIVPPERAGGPGSATPHGSASAGPVVPGGSAPGGSAAGGSVVPGGSPPTGSAVSGGPVPGGPTPAGSAVGGSAADGAATATAGPAVPRGSVLGGPTPAGSAVGGSVTGGRTADGAPPAGSATGSSPPPGSAVPGGSVPGGPTPAGSAVGGSAADGAATAGPAVPGGSASTGSATDGRTTDGAATAGPAVPGGSA